MVEVEVEEEGVKMEVEEELVVEVKEGKLQVQRGNLLVNIGNRV